MNTFYARLRHRYTLVLLLLLGGQIFMDFTLAGFTAAALAVLAAWITAHVILRPEVFPEYPISSLQMLGFSVATQALPLGATLMEGHAITYNLKFPIETFGFVGLTQVALLVGQGIYRRIPFFATVRRDLGCRALGKLGGFTAPTVGQLWFMAVVGMGAMLVGGSLSDVGGTALSKIVGGFAPLAYAPFLIPAYRLFFGLGAPVSRGQMIAVTAYFFVILLFGIVINSRGGFAASIAMVVFCFGLAFLLGRVPASFLRPKNLILAGLLGAILIIPLSRLAIAMQVARKYRGMAGPSEMIAMTWDAMLDSEKLEQYQKFTHFADRQYGFWNETYVGNPFLSRFITIKYHDLGFQEIHQYSSSEKAKLWTMSLSKFYVTFPDPVLRLMNVDINKKMINMFSMGDYMYYLSTQEGLGARKTGSLIAHGVALFGWGYFPAIVAMAMISSLLFDALALRFTPGGRLQISTIALVYIVLITTYYSGEAINSIAEFFLRGFIQIVLFYLLAFHLTRMVASSRPPVFLPAGSPR